MLFIQDTESMGHAQSKEVELYEGNAFVEDEVQRQEEEEDDKTEEDEVGEDEDNVEEVALIVEEESEIQEVVDLDSYTFRFCTCSIYDSFTDRVLPHRVVLAFPTVNRPWQSPTVESSLPLDATEYAVR